MDIGAVWIMVFNVSLGTSPTSLLHPSALLVAYPRREAGRIPSVMTRVPKRPGVLDWTVRSTRS